MSFMTLSKVSSFTKLIITKRHNLKISRIEFKKKLVKKYGNYG